MHLEANLTMTFYWSRSTQDHHLNKRDRPQIANATYQVQGHQSSGSGEKDFKGFLPLWAWRPSWSCGQDHLNKLLFSHPKE